MLRFRQSPNYVRVRAALGLIYVLLGAIILVRTCVPLNALSFSKITPLVLGAAVTGLGVLRIREFFLMKKSVSP
jgi:high-affinity Fe2+/Pb2+ permease